MGTTSNGCEQVSPPKTEKPIIARTIRDREANQLEQYFGEGRAVFERSTFGATLERAHLYRHGTFPCYDCRDTPGVSAATGEWCRRCRGTGFFSFELYTSKEALTAVPTVKVAEGGGYEPSDALLQLFGTISRRLSVVAERGAKHFPKVLEIYHGDQGHRWARSRHGRFLALFQYTRSGQRLLAKARSEGGTQIELAPADAVNSLVEVQTTQPKRRLHELIDQTKAEAIELYGSAAQAWNLAAYFLRAQRRRVPGPIGRSDVPRLYPTIRELIDDQNLREPHGKHQTIEYVAGTQEPCFGCGKTVAMPALYCERCEEKLVPSDLLDVIDEKDKRRPLALRAPVETVAGAE